MTDSFDGAQRPAVFEAEGRRVALEPHDARVGLSTASVYPESTASGFEVASRLGYDAVEVMVSVDPVSQDVDAVRHLAEYHA